MKCNLKDVFDCYSDEKIKLKESPSVSDNRVCALTDTMLGKEITTKKTFRRFPIVLVAVVAVVLLMGAGFIAASDSIDGWFMTRWEEYTGEEMTDAQYETIASLSQYIGLSQSSEGVTVTIDSATMGDDIIYVLIYVESDEAKFAPKVSAGTLFETAAIEINAPVTRFSHVGTSWQYTDENGRVCLIMKETFEVEDSDEPINVTLHFEDFCAYYAEDIGLTGAFHGGIWDFEFTLERTETHTIELTIPETWTGIHELSISEFSVYAVYDYPSYDIYPNGFRFSKVYAITESDTEIRTTSASSTSNLETGLTTARYDWAVPIDPDEIAAIRVGEEVIEVE